MAEIRELAAGETHRAAAALLELRPHHAPAGALVARADAQRAAGYRLVAALDDGEDDAAAVAGVRLTQKLAWGRHPYVDDLVTPPGPRRPGGGAGPCRPPPPPRPGPAGGGGRAGPSGAGGRRGRGGGAAGSCPSPPAWAPPARPPTACTSTAGCGSTPTTSPARWR